MNWVGALGIGALVGILLLAGCRSKRAESEREANRRLVSRLIERPDYSVFVGVPVEKPARWAKATTYNEETISTETGEIPTSTVTHFVIAYQNGQMLDAEMGRLSAPPGLDGLYEGTQDTTSSLDIAAASRGLNRLGISFSPSAAKPKSPNDFATEITNLSDVPIRVTGFGAFVENDGVFELNTITGKLFSAEEFVEWYGVGNGGWIQPGETVADGNNYGGPGAVWTYFAETRSGESFVSGKLLPPGWQGQ